MTSLTVLLVSLALVLVNGVFVAAEFALLGGAAAGARAARRARATGSPRRVLAAADVAGRCRIATSPRRSSASRSRASGSACTASTRWPTLLEPICRRIGAHRPRRARRRRSRSASLTLAHIVIGEMVPKGLALQHPEGVARFTAWPMRLTLVALYPLVKLSSSAGRAVPAPDRHQAAGRTSTSSVYTPEELQLIVEESAARRRAPRRVRRGFCASCSSSATSPPARSWCRASASSAFRSARRRSDLRRTVAEQRHTRYPVYDGDLDHIVGMLHVKDLLRRLLADERVTTADAPAAAGRARDRHARRRAGDDAAVAGAHDGRHRRARRNGGHRQPRGSVRGGRRRDRRGRAGVAADRARSGRIRPRRRHAAARRARPVLPSRPRTRRGGERERPRARAPRPPAGRRTTSSSTAGFAFRSRP